MRGRPRPVRTFGAALALLALAVQLVLSFGHFHPSDFFAGGQAPFVSQSDGATAPAAPERRAPALPAHDNCAICVTMAMAASSALPAPLILVPPGVFGRVSLPVPIRPTLAAAPRLPFQTRAPPLA
jgi:hypothetical protein